jgi:hypothetical protein
MKSFVFAGFGALLLSCTGSAQVAFEITGTPIPAKLLQQNYGSIPRGISAYDLNICNASATKESIVSSRIYQALSNSSPMLQPIGREIMFAAILRNQNHSTATILSVILTSATGVLSIVGSSNHMLRSGVAGGAAVASLSGQQLLTNLKPILSTDQLEKFETQVLEPALVLDGGSCVERTVFVASENTKAKGQALSFHIQ